MGIRSNNQETEKQIIKREDAMTQEETSMEKGMKEARKLLEQRKFGEAFERLSAMYGEPSSGGI